MPGGRAGRRGRGRRYRVRRDRRVVSACRRDLPEFDPCVGGDGQGGQLGRIRVVDLRRDRERAGKVVQGVEDGGLEDVRAGFRGCDLDRGPGEAERALLIGQVPAETAAGVVERAERRGRDEVPRFRGEVRRPDLDRLVDLGDRSWGGPRTGATRRVDDRGRARHVGARRNGTGRAAGSVGRSEGGAHVGDADDQQRRGKDADRTWSREAGSPGIRSARGGHVVSSRKLA